MSQGKNIGIFIALTALVYAGYKMITAKSTVPVKVNNGGAGSSNSQVSQNAGTKGNPIVAQNNNPVQNIPVTQTNPASTTVATPQLAVLDQNMILRINVTGKEVRELQSRLGVWSSGLFDIETLAALLARKGVHQITLEQYNTIPDRVVQVGVEPVATHSYKVGDTLITTRNATVNKYSGALYMGIETINSNVTLGTVSALVGTASSPKYKVTKPGFNIGTFATTHYEVKQSDVRKK